MISDVTDVQELTACAHQICLCTLMGPLAGAIYCSDVCRANDEGGIEGDACACGHPPCDAIQ
ncbi:MAG TPA: hypothetical protein VGN11_05140 [Candidatus Baltobacteraceae bacterium]|nr:hypothetical protein [Candidatus Baltobacteraceae bacterium]